MIQAKELRIGNFLNSDRFGICQVITIYENNFDVSTEGKHKKQWFLGLDCKGIPITEEWLLKFGFGKEWVTESGVTAKIINTQCYYHKESDLVIFMKSEIRNIDYPYIQIAKRDVKIQYVHQLQNIYFVLTESEL